MVKIETLRDLDTHLSAWPVYVIYFNTVDDEEMHQIKVNDNVEKFHKFDDMMKFFIDNADRKIDNFDFSITGDGLLLEIVFES